MGYSLTYEQIESLKAERKQGKTYFELGRDFGITFQHAQSICSGKRKQIKPDKDLSNEEWKIVPSIPVIQASNLGRIKRIETGRVLSCRPMKKTNYLQVGFSFQSKKTNRLAHRLVAEAWFGPCANGLQVNHKNGKKDDNRIENLEYVTPSRNNKHAYETGLREAKGEKNGRSKLTEEDVLEIRSLALAGINYKDLAVQFQISVQHVHAIINKRFWKHI